VTDFKVLLMFPQEGLTRTTIMGMRVGAQGMGFRAATISNSLKVNLKICKWIIKPGDSW
jgi:hypothetical protein